MKNKSSEVYLLLGSNKGDCYEMLKQSCEMIGRNCGKIVKKSSIYITSPWEFHDDHNFLNQVLLLQTSLSPKVLLNKIQIIELILGRVHYHDYYESRFIDIDILFYDKELIRDANLCIPHPLLHKRLFTLIPLAEISGNFMHPLLKKSISDLIKTCPDNSMIKKYTNVFSDNYSVGQ